MDTIHSVNGTPQPRIFPLGAIAGDVIGSVHEHAGTKTTDFPLFTPQSRFTDDSVLTVAVAEVLATGGSYRDSIQRWAQAYPHAGYGGAFRKWMWSAAAEPYGSYGNGSGMRASPVGWASRTLDEVLTEARRSAEVTHDHPEGIKGAQAVAVTCQGSVPEALIALGWEDAVRKAISLGGDADTLACMAGAVAEAFYGEVPPAIATEVVVRLDDRIRATIGGFAERFVR